MWKVEFLTSLVYLFYILLGGCIFMVLEGFDVLGMKGIDKNHTTNFADMRRILMENFTESEIKRVVTHWETRKIKSYNTSDSVLEESLSWTYSNAFFFAFHLCSTIGYGDVAPRTVWGQILPIFYATIGIPLNLLFFALLGESFAQSYQETIHKIKGNGDSYWREKLGEIMFYLLWITLIFVLPSVVFMYTENWHFIEGIYYSFITLSTVGLGDYVAGNSMGTALTYTLYKLLMLVWMIYGLAFVQLIIDYLTHLYQMYLLFTFTCEKCKCKFERIYVEIEKMDLHFRLLRAEGVKQPYSMWTVREGTRKAVGFRTNHMISLAALAERIQGEIIDLLKIYEVEESGVDSGKIPQDAFPVRKTPIDSFPVKTDNDA